METSYRIYLGSIIDVIYTDEENACEELKYLSNAMQSEDRSWQSMSAVDRLSAYIAINFQNAMFDQILRMPGIGLFLYDPLCDRWCCSNERFGSIYIRCVESLNVQGMGTL